MSPKSGENKRSQDFPAKFKDSILKRKIVIDDRVTTIIVTSLYELIECQGYEVINYINLKFHIPHEQRTAFSDVDVDVIQSSKLFVYALKINSIMFGIERSSSQLKVVKVLTNVKSFSLIVDETFGDIAAKIVFADNKELITRFQDDDVECFMRNTKDTLKFKELYHYATQKREEARQLLKSITSDVEKMSLAIHGDNKSLPKTMLADVSNHKSFT